MIPNDWKWEHPLPHGDGLRDVWTGGPNDTWVVGECGTIMHWDGGAWAIQTGQVADGWDGVWGPNRTDAKGLWIVGALGHTARYDGRGWMRVPSPTTELLHDVWGSGASDVWAVGEAGTILRWDGASWKKVPSPTMDSLLGVWGSGPNDVWAVGGLDRSPEPRRGTVLHFDGSVWTVADVGAAAADVEFGAVWGAGGDVWVGAGNTISRRRGGAWARVPRNLAMPLGTMFSGFWGTGPDDVWVVGRSVVQRWNGADWTTIQQPFNHDLWAIAGTGPENVWVVGASGFLSQQQGQTQRQHTTGVSTQLTSDVWASGPDDIWVVGSTGTVLHGDGKTWKPVDLGPLQYPDLQGVTGTGPNDVWALGEMGLTMHWDGKAWSRRDTDGGETMRDIWALAPNDVWAVGDRTIKRWNGVTWTEVPAAPPPSSSLGWLEAVHGTGPSNVWVVGSSGTIRQWNGTTWTSYDGVTTTARLNDVWVAGPKDVWVVGDGGTARRWNGTTWTVLPTGTVAPLRDIRARGNVAWATGGGLGVLGLMRFDGTSWFHYETCRYYRSLWMLGDDDVLAVSEDRGVQRRRGGTPGTKAAEDLGLDKAKRIVDLTPAEIAVLCDHAAIQSGGYGAVRQCPDGSSIHARASREDCVASYQRGPGCIATVAQAEACLRLAQSDCTLMSVDDPACKALATCAR